MHQSTSTFHTATWQLAVACAFAKCALGKIPDPSREGLAPRPADPLSLFAIALKVSIVRHVMSGSDEERAFFREPQFLLSHDDLNDRTSVLVARALQATSVRVQELDAVFQSEGNSREILEQLYNLLRATSPEISAFADEVYDLYVGSWAESLKELRVMRPSSLRSASS